MEQPRVDGPSLAFETAVVALVARAFGRGRRLDLLASVLLLSLDKLLVDLGEVENVARGEWTGSRTRLVEDCLSAPLRDVGVDAEERAWIAGLGEEQLLGVAVAAGKEFLRGLGARGQGWRRAGESVEQTSIASTSREVDGGGRLQ